MTTEGHIDLLKEQIRQRPTFVGFCKQLFSKRSLAEKRGLLEKFLFGKKRFQTYVKVSGYLSINPHIGIELEKFPIEKAKIIPIHNGVDPDRFCPVSEQEKQNLKQQLQLPSNTHFLTTVCRFVKRKRVEDLIAAWSQIANRFPHHTLLLVGDGPEKKRYEALSYQLGIHTRVLFIGFHLEIEKILQVSDLFAFCSELEGLPNVLLEAMSCQLPIVASDIAGVKEILTSFEEGLLFTPKNIQALITSLLYLLEHPEEGKQMAIAARKKILNVYSFKNTTPKFLSIYQNLNNSNSKE